MNNKPVAWAIKVGKDLIEIVDENRDFQELVDFYKLEQWDFEEVSLYTQEQLEEARKLGMQQERALWNLSESTQEIMNTHPHSEESVKVKELKQIKGVNYYVDESTIKNLTDEEILNLFEHKYDVEIDDEMLIDFARAILRKAQEK